MIDSNDLCLYITNDGIEPLQSMMLVSIVNFLIYYSHSILKNVICCLAICIQYTIWTHLYAGFKHFIHISTVINCYRFCLNIFRIPVILNMLRQNDKIWLLFCSQASVSWFFGWSTYIGNIRLIEHGIQHFICSGLRHQYSAFSA